VREAQHNVVYTKDGESYVIVDAHIALWDVRPENQATSMGSSSSTASTITTTTSARTRSCGPTRVHLTTIEIISREINTIANLVGSNHDLEDLDGGRVPGGRSILTA
jgi:hypothetical protein